MPVKIKAGAVGDASVVGGYISRGQSVALTRSSHVTAGIRGMALRTVKERL